MKTAFVLLALAAAAMAETRLNEKPVSGLCGNTSQWAGYLELDEATDKNYFYWYFESQNDPSTDPLVMWLSGGPGCSSMLALFGENGPCKVNEQGTGTYPNPYSWNTKANVMWVDQPAGTGFSYGDESGYDHNEKEVSDDMYTFLQLFFKNHPSLQGRPFYVFGESYGGHYAPSVAYRIYEGNQNSSNLPINLAGLATGNGLTDPEVQYRYYGQLAYNYSMSVLGQPIISLNQYEGMMQAWPQCHAMIAQCQQSTGSCADAEDFCNTAMMQPYEETGRNVYDIRKMCTYEPLCYNFDNVQTFLNTPSVQQELGVNRKWAPCNFVVNSGFGDDWMKNYQWEVPPLLASGTRVLVYAGDMDFICNWLGNQAWALALDWPHKQDFNNAPMQEWSVPGTPGGQARTSNGFTFLRVHNAGHMAPMDQPQYTLAMLNEFISGGSFN